MDWDKAGISTLRAVLDVIKLDTRKTKEAEKQRSHKLANGFCHTLKNEPGVAVLPDDEPRGNANYFFIKIDGITLGITPFGSHKEFWEKPSEGFLCKVGKRDCSWGVVLFDLLQDEGLWIEGPDFVNKFKYKKKVNSSDVRQARKEGVARPFPIENSKFIELVKHPPKKLGEPYLIRKAR